MRDHTRSEAQASQCSPAFVEATPKSPAESNLVIVPDAEARHLAAMDSAIQSAQSWKDFCESMPATDLLDVKAGLVDRDVPLPKDDAAFDVDLLPG